jgi:hypothetical protein
VYFGPGSAYQPQQDQYSQGQQPDYGNYFQGSQDPTSPMMRAKGGATGLGPDTVGASASPLAPATPTTLNSMDPYHVNFTPGASKDTANMYNSYLNNSDPGLQNVNSQAAMQNYYSKFGGQPTNMGGVNVDASGFQNPGTNANSQDYINQQLQHLAGSSPNTWNQGNMGYQPMMNWMFNPDGQSSQWGSQDWAKHAQAWTQGISNYTTSPGGYGFDDGQKKDLQSYVQQMYQDHLNSMRSSGQWGQAGSYTYNGGGY